MHLKLPKLYPANFYFSLLYITSLTSHVGYNLDSYGRTTTRTCRAESEFVQHLSTAVTFYCY